MTGIERWQEKPQVGKPPLKLKPSYSNPSAASVSPLTKDLIRSHISQSAEAAQQMVSEADPSDPQRQLAETNLAFLKWMVDPRTYVLGLPPRSEHIQLIREGLSVDIVKSDGPDGTIGKEPEAMTGKDDINILSQCVE